MQLPVAVDAQRVTAAALRPAARQVRTALSAPVQLAVTKGRFELRPYRLARLLDLPRGGRTDLRIAGIEADSFFVRLDRTIERPARDASFEPVASGVRLVPARKGREVDVPATARSILRAALSPTNRLARLALVRTAPHLTTAEAKSRGIREVVGTYTTEYGGIANRIHNVQLVAHLIDGHFIPPHQEFSFNNTTGSRDASKGFLEAPVIINGELQNGLGGGVCQVSTTVFNAAYEAGLRITSRTNHALYISHYPLGRDATVNYPDTDLRFVNDTDHWLLLRSFVGSSSLTVTLYGTSPHRKVVSESAPLTVVGPVPVREIEDPALLVGDDVVDAAGSPALATSVERRVYTKGGKLLYDDNWSSHYRGEYRIVRIGTKKPPPPPPPPTKNPTTDDDRDDRRRPRRPRRRPLRRRRRRAAAAASADTDLYDSALAIASTIHCGRRVGRSVCASTHACVVQPSATRAPSPARSSEVVVAEARTANIDTARPDPDDVVEHGRREVANVRLDDRRLVARVLKGAIAGRVLVEIGDARHFEPDEVRGVVGDPLRIRLREPNANLGREAEALHAPHSTMAP